MKTRVLCWSLSHFFVVLHYISLNIQAELYNLPPLQFVGKLDRIVAIVSFALVQVNNPRVHIYCLGPEKSINLVHSCHCWLMSICNLQNTEYYGNNAVKPGQFKLRGRRPTGGNKSTGFVWPSSAKIYDICKSRVESPSQLQPVSWHLRHWICYIFVSELD